MAPNSLCGRWLGAEFFPEQFVDLRRIGLALRGLHHLPDEITEQRFFPGAVLFQLLGVFRDDLVDDLLDRAGIGDLFQALLRDHSIGIAFAVPHGFEDFFGDLAGDGVVGEAFEQARHHADRDR